MLIAMMPTILVNGFTISSGWIKKRGVAIREAFNQVHQIYQKSLQQNSSLDTLRSFVISNGTDTRYFANTIKRDKNSFDFTMNWVKADNTLIKDLKDFTTTFFEKSIVKCVINLFRFWSSGTALLIMRPYQIAANRKNVVENWKFLPKQNWSKPDSGGYIWHTTGSGKTLTSFKAARLATQFGFYW